MTINWRKGLALVGIFLAAFAAIINSMDISVTVFILAIIAGINAVIHLSNNV